ncbi:MAG: sodium-dependent bicarbonate transport family permease [Planctomycetota bacterium]
MPLAPLLDNLLSAPILFFGLGMLATAVRSDLEIPKPMARFLSLYLLIAIGLKGGAELRAAGLDLHIILTLGVAVASAFVVPIWTFFLLRLKLDAPNAAALAATYGSISAVTFITAEAFLENQEIASSGYMVAAMALMESPAIIVGVLLARHYAPATRPTPSDSLPGPTHHATSLNLGELLREAVCNGAVLVLLGSMVIGAIIPDDNMAAITPGFKAPFTALLCVFLLDMGLVAARKLGDLKTGGAFLIGFGILAAPVHAALGIGLAALLQLPVGDALLLAVLIGSASYIAVPAAMRLSVPDANPSIYVPMALAITFPFNVTLGIPLYLAAIQALWGT